MNESEIRKYAELMKELGLTRLEFNDDKKVVRLERAIPPAAAPVSAAPVPLQQTVPAASTPEQRDYTSVRAPMVGVFYSAPAANAEPFVSPGDRVEKGKTLCIIEAMKLMNEICAEESGVITEVCVTNGQVVEYGTELFRFRRENA